MHRSFRSLIAFAVLACAFTTANAAIESDAARQAGFGKLTETEKAEVLKTIAEKAAGRAEEAAHGAISAAKKADEWLNVGERVGKMFAGAAKEVGMAVNEFAKTPVGMLAMGLIVWNYMGGVAIHFGGALIVLMSSGAFMLWFARRRREVLYQYDPEKTDIFGRSRLVSVERRKMDDDTMTAIVIMWGLTAIATIWIMFSF
jgi:hypothetical protein